MSTLQPLANSCHCVQRIPHCIATAVRRPAEGATCSAARLFSRAVERRPLRNRASKRRGRRPRDCWTPVVQQSEAPNRANVYCESVPGPKSCIRYMITLIIMYRKKRGKMINKKLDPATNRIKSTGCRVPHVRARDALPVPLHGWLSQKCKIYLA